MNFKSQVRNDLKNVFHNPKEFAEETEFWIDGIRYKGPVIIDDSNVIERKKPSSDYADGLNLVEIVMYIPLELLKKVPEQGYQVELDGIFYNIAKVHNESSEIVLYLEALDE